MSQAPFLRPPLYDPGAPRQTVSVTLNADLYAKAKSLDINTSRVAEEALAYVVRQKLNEQIKCEVDQDIRVLNAMVEAHRDEFDAMQRELDQLNLDAARGDQPAAAPAPAPSSARRRRR